MIIKLFVFYLLVERQVVDGFRVGFRIVVFVCCTGGRFVEGFPIMG